jgi:hypothetical protein
MALEGSVIRGPVMLPRASLLAVFLFWMAYESHFSPQFFIHTVRASLTDMQIGLLDAMNGNGAARLHTASTE